MQPALSPEPSGTALAPPSGVIGLPRLSLSQTDVIDGGDGPRTQARYELHRALDFGTAADLAIWARRWGPTMLEGCEQLVAERDRSSAAMLNVEGYDDPDTGGVEDELSSAESYIDKVISGLAVLTGTELIADAAAKCRIAILDAGTELDKL